MTQAKNLDDLRYDLERMIVGHIAVSLENGLKPFRNGRRAPEKYWAMFRRSRISLPQQSFGLRVKKRGVKIPVLKFESPPSPPDPSKWWDSIVYLWRDADHYIRLIARTLSAESARAWLAGSCILCILE